jgi:hypothetical protein
MSRTVSKTDQFRQYAKESVLSAGEAKTGGDRRGLLVLAQTWTQAALAEHRSPSDNTKTARAA